MEKHSKKLAENLAKKQIKHGSNKRIPQYTCYHLTVHPPLAYLDSDEDKNARQCYEKAFVLSPAFQNIKLFLGLSFSNWLDMASAQRDQHLGKIIAETKLREL